MRNKLASNLNESDILFSVCNKCRAAMVLVLVEMVTEGGPDIIIRTGIASCDGIIE